MAIVAERIGGQVKETVGIENLISVPKTTGNELANNLKTHLLRYPVDLLEHRKIEKVEVLGKQKIVTTSVGRNFWLRH
ncbi:hypothetical protein BFINE_15100 [Bacteroides finegoldii DSM 17565]|nr:hypothetical protein BFINE_15100 [Bacteroides finegoldii DSM 17565]